MPPEGAQATSGVDSTENDRSCRACNVKFHPQWAAGIEPDAHDVSRGYGSGHSSDTSGTEAGYLGQDQGGTAGGDTQKGRDAGHNQDSAGHKKCGTYVDRWPDLARLAEFWSDLSEATRAAIVTLAEGARRE